MPVEETSESGARYYLVAFDERGNERIDDPEGLMSRRVMEILKAEPVTDVFLLSHGWQGDIPAARQQYSRWVETMVRCTRDYQKMQQSCSGYHPLMIGLHWPSLPWGDEELGGAGTSFTLQSTAPVEDFIDRNAARLGNSAATRRSLRVIIDAARHDIAPDNLPTEVREAYLELDREASMSSDGEGAHPGADREPFDPDAIYDSAQQSVSFGSGDLGGLLAPLRALSFWKMKDRALVFGETSAHQLLCELQSYCAESVRFHLMGHSFGCIVASAALAGPMGAAGLPRPAHSLALVQGALSHWSYCADIPVARGRPGYFRPLVEMQRVSGPILTTSSARDTAVGRFYPLGAGARGDLVFTPGTLPKYGAVGTFGMRGPGLNIKDMEMGPADFDYPFEPGTIYNLESTRYITYGGGFSGAHSDIAHPEVAHTVWSAARCTF